MNVIVVGCGRLGAELAYRLFKQGHEVAVVDWQVSAFNILPPDFNGRTIEGDALTQDTLHRAGIEHAEGLAAATGSDALNAAVAHIAREIYGIKRVVVRNYEPPTRKLLETFGFQVVSAASWGAQRMEELLYHSYIRTVFSSGNGEVEIYEIVVPERWHNTTASDMLDCQQCRLVSLARAGKALLPDDSTLLETGDVILVSATLAGIQELRDRLSAEQEG
jgi:trk system potassium uptake protein TrkA